LREIDKKAVAVKHKQNDADLSNEVQ